MLFMLYSALRVLRFPVFSLSIPLLLSPVLRRYCRDVRRNEPVRLHHEARLSGFGNMLFMALIGIVLASRLTSG